MENENEIENDKEDIDECQESFENKVKEADVPETISWKDYFHGEMSKGDAEGLLEGKHEGTFVLRENNGGLRFTRVPHRDGGKREHILLNQDQEDNYYFVRGRIFPRIEDLVNHYQVCKGC